MREMQKNITMDMLSHALDSRPSEDELYERGLMKNRRGSMSDVLQPIAVALEKEMKADAISSTIAKRASDLGTMGAPLTKRSSISNVLAGTSKELEKQLTTNQVSSGFSRRSSQQDLLERGILKRPTSESNVLAGTAVALEKALASDRVSAKIAEKVKAYVGSTNGKSASESKQPDQVGSGVKERMNAYLAAVRESNASAKPVPMGEGIKERMRAYQDATKASQSPKIPSQTLVVQSPAIEVQSPTIKIESPRESKAVESPRSPSTEQPIDSPRSTGSLKDRVNAYQEAASSKSSPKNQVLAGASLKERMSAYQEAATTSNVKKQIDILPSEDGVSNRVSAYMGATSSPTKKGELEDEEDGNTN